MGEYKVHNERLKLLHKQASSLTSSFDEFRIRWVPPLDGPAMEGTRCALIRLLCPCLFVAVT